MIFNKLSHLVSTEEYLKMCLSLLEELDLKASLLPLSPVLLIKQEGVLCNSEVSVMRTASVLHFTAS